ncbi:MAG: DUF5686 family protein [Bacteroidia bacterium]
MRWFLMIGITWGQIFSISGEVRSHTGEPLGHVIVRLPQTGFQTVSSAEGRFTLTIALDTVIIELRHLGYRLHRDTLYRSEDKRFYTFTLYPQEVKLGGVIITEEGKDPGEILARKAITMKFQNRRCLPSFRAESYTLFTLRWFDPPNPLVSRLLRQSSAQNKDVLFMSETFSYIYFTAADKYHEEIVRSRIVGTQRYSFLGGWVFQGFDPYAERLSLQDVTEAAFILPLARDAPLYYRYRLIGSYWDEDNLFYQVAVEPRSSVSPCVEGYMVISDGTYALVGLEWNIRAPRPLRYTDSIGVRVTYVPISGCYQIGEVSFKGRFRVSTPVGDLSLLGEGYAAYRKYQVLVISEPDRKKATSPPVQTSKRRVDSVPDTLQSKAFPLPETLRVSRLDFGEFVRVLPEASNAPTTFWDSIRSAPLDSVQADYIARHEEMVAARETTSSKGRSGFGFTEEGIGWSKRIPTSGGSILVSMSQRWIGYTPIEGWVLPWQASWEVRAKQNILELRVVGRYGMGWRRLLPATEVSWNTSSYPQWRAHLAGGLQVREPTDFVQIPELWNILYRLAGRESVWQGFACPFIEISGGKYFHRTIELQAKVRWDVRATQYQGTETYPGWRSALWVVWRPGTRLFRTPRSTQFIPPQKVLTWQVDVAGESAWLPNRTLLTLSGMVKPTLSISPFGRLQMQIGGAWQSQSAPWADRLYIRSMFVPLHRGYGDFWGWSPYESLGRWSAIGILNWSPEGAIFRLLPLLRRTSWQEAFALRILYTQSAGWYAESSVFLHQLNLRLRKTGVSRPFSVGFHWVLLGRERRGGFTLGLGDILRPAIHPKPSRS